jgi:hypothetical protein
MKRSHYASRPPKAHATDAVHGGNAPTRSIPISSKLIFDENVAQVAIRGNRKHLIIFLNLSGRRPTPFDNQHLHRFIE